jgi:hypothetical protein
MFKIANTKDALTSPLGHRYVHDASRPWALLETTRRGEICRGRYASERLAKAAMRHAVRMRELEA